MLIRHCDIFAIDYTPVSFAATDDDDDILLPLDRS
jgi:hypothetical protein